MGAMLRYAVTGGLNTLVHRCLFCAMVMMGSPQSLANLMAFIVAVTGSFFVNARWTFKVQPSLGRYLAMVIAMGVLSYLVGGAADHSGLNPVLTLVAFSLFSLVIGFLAARFIVFRRFIEN